MADIQDALREFVQGHSRDVLQEVLSDLPEQIREFRSEMREMRRAVDELSSEVRGLSMRAAAAPEGAEYLPFSPDDIKRLRERFDLTQQELAELLEVSPVTVTAWETGKSRPRKANLEQIVELQEADQAQIDERLGRQSVVDTSPADIKRLRRRLGLTQTALAELIGVSAAAVTSWETGKTIPSRDNRQTLAELMEKPLAELEEQLSSSGMILPRDLDISGEEIRQIRHNLGFSQRELASELGVSVNSISNWETGRTAPRRSSIRKLLELQRRLH